MNKEELVNYLIEECEYSKRAVENMTPREMVDAWLTYNGIVFYTESILDAIGAAYDIDFEGLNMEVE